MNESFARFEMLVGRDAAGSIAASHVAVVGLGGVGGQAAEALIRCGVGEITLIDGDTVQPTNLNRQIIADTRTMGLPKTEVMARRAADINPQLRIHVLPLFVTTDNIGDILEPGFDYVVDAIDDVKAKIALIIACRERGIPIVSSAGTACRLDPSRLRCVDLFKTDYDPLARRMRKRLRKAGVTSLDVVCSSEQPAPTRLDKSLGKRVGGSAVFVTATAGLLLAGHVVKALAGPQGGQTNAP